MTIDPEIVARAKSNAVALFRPHPPASLPSPRPSRSVSPLLSHRPSRVPDPYHYHSDYDRRLLLSPYTDTEVDYYPMPEPCNRHAYPAALTARRIPTSRPSTAPAPPPAPTPLHSPGWAVANQLPPPQIHPAYHQRTVSHLHEDLHGLNASANPWLSAIPRSPAPGAAPSNNNNNNNNWHPYHPRPHHHHHHNHNHHHHQTPPPSTSLPARGITLAPLRLKRRFAQLDHHPTDADTPYDAGSSHAGSPSASPISVVVDLDDEQPTTTTTTREKSIQGLNLSQPTTTPSRPITSGSAVRNNNNEEEEVNTTTSTTMTNTTSTPATSTVPPRRSARAASERDVAIMLIHMRAAMRGGRDSEEEAAADMMPARGSRDASASGSAASFAAGGAGGAFAGGGGSAAASTAGASTAGAAGGSAGGALATPSGSASPAISGKDGRWEDGEHETRSKRRRTVEGGEWGFGTGDE